MKYEWLDGYCLGKEGAVFEVKPEWEAGLFRVGGKIFAMKCSDSKGRTIITLKCEPAFGELIRNAYPDIRPGYYMNKLHWNSVDLAGEAPDGVVKDMIDMSYRLIVSSLSKKSRQALHIE